MGFVARSAVYPGSLTVFKRNMENDLGTHFKTRLESSSQILRTHYRNTKLRKDLEHARNVTLGHMYDVLCAMENTTEKLSNKVLRFKKVLGNVIEAYDSFKSSKSKPSDVISALDEFDLVISDPYLWRDDVNELQSDTTTTNEENEPMDVEHGQHHEETPSNIRAEMTKALIEGSPSTLLQIVISVYRFTSRIIKQYRRASKQTSCLISLNYLRQSLLLNYPNSNQEFIITHDGLRLDCAFIPTMKKKSSSRLNRKIVVVCNPNAGLYECYHDPEQSSKIKYFLHTRGFDVFVWNYRGYGRSEGTPSPQNNNKDGLAVLNHLVSKFPGETIEFCVSAESIGGLVGCFVASERPDLVKVLIADRTFGSLSATAHYILAPWAGRVLSKILGWDGNNTQSYLKYSGMKIVCNDTHDTIIHDMASLKTSIANSVELGCDHCGRDLEIVEEEEEENNDVIVVTPPTTPIKNKTRRQSESSIRTLRRRTPLKENKKLSFFEYEEPGRVEESNSKFNNRKEDHKQQRNVCRLTESLVQRFYDCLQRLLARAVIASANRQLRVRQFGGGHTDEFYSSVLVDTLLALDGRCGNQLGDAMGNGLNGVRAFFTSFLVFGPLVSSSHVVKHQGMRVGRRLSIDHALSTVCRVTEQRQDIHGSNSSSNSSTISYDDKENMLSPQHFEQDLKFVKRFLTYLRDEILLRKKLYEEIATNKKVLYQQPIGAFIPLGCGHNYPYRSDEVELLNQCLDVAGW